MVLVEVGEAIIEQDRRLDVEGNVKGQNADIGLSGKSRVWPCVILLRMAPLGLVYDLALERRRPTIARYFLERLIVVRVDVRGGLGRLLDAIRVVNGEFVDLRAMSATNSCACSTRVMTFSLAYMRSPPMGANMSPTIKNSGRTVFGVKMGLSQVG